MHSYAFEVLKMNGRDVTLDSIVEGKAQSLTTFEHSAFSFIKQWFSTVALFKLQTSGSTGAPKTITVTRKQMETSAYLTCEALQLKKGDTAFICLDANYIAGKMMFVRSFLAGMKIIFVNPSSNPFLGLATDTVIDFTALVPLQLHEIVYSEQSHWLNTIKKIIVGGAPISEHIQTLLRRFNSAIYATYGMTETVSHIALQRVNGYTPAAYFETLPGIDIGTDGRGCLEIKAFYVDEKVVTNDLVDIIDATHFKWLGRADNVINTGGIKVLPENIEMKISDVLVQSHVTNTFFVTGIPDEVLGSKIILLIGGQIALSTDALKTLFRKVLAPHEMPKEIYTDIKIVLTNTGKIDKAGTLLQAPILG